MRLIDADALVAELENGLWDWDSVNGITAETVLRQTISDIKNAPTIDALPVVRCRDCKHRPIPTKPSFHGGEWLDFPDSVCPCQCEDMWYSWNPDGDWFCGNGERKEKE